jgi:hypothetical protein
MSSETENNLAFDKNYATASAAFLAPVAVAMFVPALRDGRMYFLFLTDIIFSTLSGDAFSGACVNVLSFVLNFFPPDIISENPQTLSATAWCCTLSVYPPILRFTFASRKRPPKPHAALPKAVIE